MVCNPDKRNQKSCFVILFVSLLVISVFILRTNAYAETMSYEKDQAIDEKYNLFQVVSRFVNHLRSNSADRQPAEMQSGTLPPYFQQPERASNIGLTPGSGAQTVCVPSKGHPCP